MESDVALECEPHAFGIPRGALQKFDSLEPVLVIPVPDGPLSDEELYQYLESLPPWKPGEDSTEPSSSRVVLTLEEVEELHRRFASE